MKPERHLKQICLITLFSVIAIASKAQLQDLESADLSPQSIEINSSETEEKPSKVLSNPDKDSVPKVNNSKSRSTPEPGKPEKVKEEVKEEDSILSFNFIYYIIKKFKLSDIVDR